MNEATKHVRERDDKEAVRRTVRFFIAHHREWFLVMVMVCLITPLWSLGGGMERDGAPSGIIMYWAILAIGWWNATLVRKSRSMGALPMRRPDLGKALWLLTVFVPYALMTGSSLLAASMWSRTETCSGGFAEGVMRALSYMAFMVLLPAFLSLACVFRAIRKLGYAQTLLSDNWMAVPLIACFVPLYYLLKYGSDQTGMVCWMLGAAGLAVSYSLREHLILESARAARSHGRTVSRTASRPAPGSWWLSFLVSSRWALLFSVLVSALMAVSIGSALAKNNFDLSFELVMVADCAVMCAFALWFQWSMTLRTWRMLPLSRPRLAQTVASMSVLCAGVPFVACIAVYAAVQLARGASVAQPCAFYAGAGMVLQGFLCAALPRLLRGHADTNGVRIAKGVAVMMGVVMMVAFLSGVCSAQINRSMQTHGWFIFVIGCAILCLGGVVSAWRTSRVLRHSDCYGRATE